MALRGQFVRFIGILLFILASMVASQSAWANGQNRLVCEVKVASGSVRSAYAMRICKAVSRALKAQILTGRMKSMMSSVNGNKKIFRLRARIVSPYQVRYAFEAGTPAEWKTNRQRRYDNLALDIQDAQLNEAAINHLANTLVLLSNR